MIGKIFYDYGQRNQKLHLSFTWAARKERYLRNCFEFEIHFRIKLYILKNLKKAQLYVIRQCKGWHRHPNGWGSMNNKIKASHQQDIDDGTRKWNIKQTQKRKDTVYLLMLLLMHLIDYLAGDGSGDNWCQVRQDETYYSQNSRDNESVKQMKNIINELYDCDDSKFEPIFENTHMVQGDQYYTALDVNQYGMNDFMDDELLAAIDRKHDRYDKCTYKFLMKLGLENKRRKNGLSDDETERLKKLRDYSKTFGHANKRYECITLNATTLYFVKLQTEVKYRTKNNQLIGIERIKSWPFGPKYESHVKNNKNANCFELSNDTENWQGPSRGIVCAKDVESWQKAIERAYQKEWAHLFELQKLCINEFNLIDFAQGCGNFQCLKENQYVGNNAWASNNYGYNEKDNQLLDNGNGQINSHIDHSVQHEYAGTWKVGTNKEDCLNGIQNHGGCRASRSAFSVPHGNHRYTMLSSK